ncbi:MAG: hypothetical protein WC612_07290 [Bdellovibrionales bacterium]|jgi:hypothetical protein
MTELNELEKGLAQKIMSLPSRLREPIVLSKDIDWDGNDEKSLFEAREAAWVNQINNELNEKYHLLMEHYNITTREATNDVLTLKLMHDFIPGFKIVFEKKKGRPSVWSPELSTLLFCVVQLKILNGGCKSETNACDHLSCDEPWKGFLEKTIQRKKGTRSQKDGAIILQEQYRKAKKLPFPQAFLCARELLDKVTLTEKLLYVSTKMSEAYFIYREQKDEIIIQYDTPDKGSP